jgi:hypothetical protein
VRNTAKGGEAHKEVVAVQRRSLWPAVRVLALVLAAAVLLLNLATPRTSVSSGDDLMPPPVSREQQLPCVREGVAQPRERGRGTRLLTGGDDGPAVGEPARAE